MATAIRTEYRPRFRVSHKLSAAERLMRGESPAAVADSLRAPVELVEKWHQVFVEAGRDALRYTRDPDEMPDLETLQLTAQKAFPTRLLHDCDSAASFFCAQFYGKNDTIHLYAAGVPQVTLVDIQADKLAAMRDMYPADWETIEGDAFDVARRLGAAGRRFDIVICDTYTPLGAQVAFDEFPLFAGLCRKHLLLMYDRMMFDALGIPPDGPALSAALAARWGRPVCVADVIKRSSFAGGVYWAVFQV